MRKIKCVLAALAIQGALSYSPYLLAFERPKLPLDEKVARATLVALGTVTEVNFQDPRRAGNESIALLHVERVLKGSAAEDIRVVYRNGIADLALDCCAKGGRYLLFLSEDKRGFFESVSGADGVYRVDVPEARSP